MSRPLVSCDGFSWVPLGARDPVVSDLDLTVAAGERVLIAGASGSGKSTLLNAMAGALGTTIPGEVSGSVAVTGRVGLVLQNPADALVAQRIGRDVAFGPENLGLPHDEIWRRVDRALAAVRLPYSSDRPTHALSGGEQQRLVLAGALAVEPDLMLLDEPTSMLDPQAARVVREAVLEAVGGRTLIVVEHRVDDWLPSVDRVIALAAGRVVFDGTPDDFARGDVPGVWMPGRPAPEPVPVAESLVRPSTSTSATADCVTVDLVSRGLRGSVRTRALRDFSLSPVNGRTTALYGPSGSGKSTALGVLGGLVRPTTGQVTPDRSRWRSKRLAADVGWQPQNPESGFLAATVRDEVERTAHVLGRTIAADAIVDTFALGHRASVHPLRLSGGEQRRLAFAAAVAHRPSLLLLDEPTVGQDPGGWARLTGWLSAAAAAGAAVVVSTHDADLPHDDRQVIAR